MGSEPNDGERFGESESLDKEEREVLIVFWGGSEVHEGGDKMTVVVLARSGIEGAGLVTIVL